MSAFLTAVLSLFRAASMAFAYAEFPVLGPFMVLEKSEAIAAAAAAQTEAATEAATEVAAE